MQDNLDKVTVLMPVYNAEKYLHDAIDSILNQTFTNYEFLIIDDGSTDGSASIINNFKDERIRFIQNETNLGLVETLNKGIQLSTTELIARMDADDISYPERLQRQVTFFQSNPGCSLLATWARIVDSNYQVQMIEYLKPKYYRYNLTFECWIYHPTVMYKRHAVENVGMYVSKYSEDFDLWWRISRKYQFDVLPEILLDYRTTDSSFSRVVKKNGI